MLMIVCVPHKVSLLCILPVVHGLVSHNFPHLLTGSVSAALADVKNNIQHHFTHTDHPVRVQTHENDDSDVLLNDPMASGVSPPEEDVTLLVKANRVARNAGRQLSDKEERHIINLHVTFHSDCRIHGCKRKTKSTCLN